MNEKYIFLKAKAPYDRVYVQGEYDEELQTKLDKLLSDFIDKYKPLSYRIINVTVVNLLPIGRESGEVPISSSMEYTLHIAYTTQ